MKPGDLVTLRKWNIYARVPITRVALHGDRFAEYSTCVHMWEQGEVGLLLEERAIPMGLVQVLHGGRIGWIEEVLIEAVAPGEGQDGPAVAPG